MAVVQGPLIAPSYHSKAPEASTTVPAVWPPCSDTTCGVGVSGVPARFATQGEFVSNLNGTICTIAVGPRHLDACRNRAQQENPGIPAPPGRT